MHWKYEDWSKFSFCSIYMSDLIELSAPYLVTEINHIHSLVFTIDIQSQSFFLVSLLLFFLTSGRGIDEYFILLWVSFIHCFFHSFSLDLRVAQYGLWRITFGFLRLINLVVWYEILVLKLCDVSLIFIILWKSKFMNLLYMCILNFEIRLAWMINY